MEQQDRDTDQARHQRTLPVVPSVPLSQAFQPPEHEAEVKKPRFSDEEKGRHNSWLKDASIAELTNDEGTTKRAEPRGYGIPLPVLHHTPTSSLLDPSDPNYKVSITSGNKTTHVPRAYPSDIFSMKGSQQALRSVMRLVGKEASNQNPRKLSGLLAQSNVNPDDDTDIFRAKQAIQSSGKEKLHQYRDFALHRQLPKILAHARDMQAKIDGQKDPAGKKKYNDLYQQTLRDIEAWKLVDHRNQELSNLSG